MQVLLIEPDYANKYPPLGLMKISTFFKNRGDDVVFFKGRSKEIRDEFDWDFILITSLFTFEWKTTVDTIKFYSCAPSKPTVMCGGILASLMPDELYRETGVKICTGLWDKPGILGLKGEETIEFQIPDYSMLDDIDYKYAAADSYFVHFTRGCVNNCKFCSVPKLEPCFVPYRPVAKTVEEIDKLYGPKQNMLVMDNNTAASPHFARIISEISECGFYKGAILKGKQRAIDFNQGLDARNLSLEKIKALSTLCVKPVRIAFDDIRLKPTYERCIRWAASCGITRLSNYVLYNYRDTPEDFYERLRINVDLNEELKTSIYSFPMKYSPIEQTSRTYIGENWNWRYLRGVKCILQATHGVVGTKLDFFLRAFGKNASEFKELISMPERFIINREDMESESTIWRENLRALEDVAMDDFRFRALNSRKPKLGSSYPSVEHLLAQY